MTYGIIDETPSEALRQYNRDDAEESNSSLVFISRFLLLKKAREKYYAGSYLVGLQWHFCASLD